MIKSARYHLSLSMTTRGVAAFLFLLTLTQNLFPVLNSLPSMLVDAEADTTICAMACCRGKEKNPNCCCKKSHTPSTPSLLFANDIPVGLLQEAAAKVTEAKSSEPQTSQAELSDHCASMAAAEQPNVDAVVIDQSKLVASEKAFTKAFEKVTYSQPADRHCEIISVAELSKPCPCDEAVAPAHLRGLDCAAIINQSIKPPPDQLINGDSAYQSAFLIISFYQQVPARAPPCLT